MVELYDKDTGARIGSITDSQLRFLVAQMEEESLEDRDYAITPMTIDFFETQGADPELVALLRQALGSRSEMTIQWESPEVSIE